MAQPVPVTVPRIWSPGATTTGVVCMSLPERQQCSLSIDHLPRVSPLKSSTGCRMSPPPAVVRMSLKNAMSWLATLVGGGGTISSVTRVEPGVMLPSYS